MGVTKKKYNKYNFFWKKMKKIRWLILVSYLMAEVESSCEFQYWAGADFQGSDLIRPQATSLEDCILKCKARSDCTTFLYHTGGACWLKAAPGNNLAILSDEFTGGYKCNIESTYDILGTIKGVYPGSVTTCTDFGTCTATCGGGTHTCQNTCSGYWGEQACSTTKKTNTQTCNTTKCPYWSNWVTWSSCSINCGPGKQTRSRRCTDSSDADRTGHSDCVGEYTQQKDCNLKKCVTIECEKEKMYVKFDKQHLSRNSVTSDYDLNLDTCLAKDTRTITSEDIELCAELGIGKCGAEMEMNNTHVNYKNNVIAEKGFNHGIIRFDNLDYKNYKLPYECAYPLDYLVTPSADTNGDGVPDSDYGSLKPKISEVVTVVPVDMIKGGIKGDGKFPVMMMMYKSDEYKAVYNSPPTLEVDSRMYIETHLLKGPDEATVQTKKCWMTPTKNIDDELSYTIIDNFCPVSDAVTKADVAILKNGKDFASRWEVDVFKFTGADDIFVHCRVRLCFKSDSQKCDVFNCAERRKRRDVQITVTEDYDQDDDITVSMGPVSVQTGDLEITITTNSDGNGLSRNNMIIMAVVIVTAVLISCLVIAAFRMKKNKHEELK